MNRSTREINHFEKLNHIWWGALTRAGQVRYDLKYQKFRKLCAPLSVKTKILEIGCGDGEFTKRLVKTRSKITATDITPIVLKRGRQLIRSKNVNFKFADCEKLPFADQTFDIVCGISILHHVNYKKAIKEIHRVLKPGGQLFFTEPNLANPLIFFILRSNYLRRIFEHSPDETALLRSKITPLLTKSGFIPSVTNYDFLHPFTPNFLIGAVIFLSSVLERTPLVKEISGSLLIYAQKK